MEKKRSYGRRTTDENRQTSPRTNRRSTNDEERPKPRRRYDNEGEAKRPYRTKSASDKPYGAPDRRKSASDKPYRAADKAKSYTDKPRYASDKPKSYTERPRKAPAKKQPVEDNGPVRLNKFIANSGICSRREADTYIETGLVTVNGVIVTELGTKIDPLKDDVRFNGQRIKGEKKVYIVMNKPKDFVTTMADPHADRTVMDLISKTLCPERVFPVGRLDKATTGVLLFTNDGDLTEKLTHPKHEVRKIYHATLDKNLKKEDFDKILSGIELEDGPIAADALSYVEDDKTQVGLEIHSGRNRIVRRMFEHLGYKVKKLDRVYFAGLTKKNLRRGAWRFLDEKEIALLKMGAFE